MVDDYREYQVNNAQGGKDQTKVDTANATAPAKNWKTQIAQTQAWDNTLLTENNAKTQLPADQLYPVTRGINTNSSGSWSWNGFTWIGTNVL